MESATALDQVSAINATEGGELLLAAPTTISSDQVGPGIMINVFDNDGRERRLLLRSVQELTVVTAGQVVDFVRGELATLSQNPNYALFTPDVVPEGSKIYAQIFGDGAQDQPLPSVDPFTPSTVPRFLRRLDTASDATLAAIPEGTQVLEVNPKKFIVNVLVRLPDGSLTRGAFGARETDKVLPVNKSGWNSAMIAFIYSKTDSHFASSQGATGAAVCETMDFRVTCNKLPGKSFVMRRSHRGAQDFTIMDADQSLFEAGSNVYANLLTVDNSDGMINLVVERADTEPTWTAAWSWVIMGITFVLLGIFYLGFDRRAIRELVADAADNKGIPCRKRWGQLTNMKLLFLVLLVISLFVLTFAHSFATVVITHGIAWTLLFMLFISFYRRRPSARTAIFTHSSWLLVPLVLLAMHAADIFLSECNDISTFDHAPLVFAVAALALATLADVSNARKIDDQLNDGSFLVESQFDAMAKDDPTIPNLQSNITRKVRELQGKAAAAAR